MTHHKLLPTLLILLSSSLLMAKDAEKEQFNSNIAQFIENKGQITDQHGTPRTDIHYKLSGGPVTIYIGDGQMHYQFYKTETQPGQSLHDNRDPFAIDSMHTGMQEQADSISIYRLDVTLVGANPNAQLITAQRSDYYENYYGPGLGEDGVKARACAKLIYKDVYPGIDWVLYTTLKEGIPSLKYDFVIHSGADPSVIRLRYDGATNLQLQDDALLAETPYGSITEAAPYTYNAATHEPVNSSFILSDNELSFSLGTHSGDIVIDPSLKWCTYYGGASYENGRAVSTSLDRHVYIGGSTHSSSNIATSGAHQSTLTSNYDAYLVKFDDSCNRIWATYVGGEKNDVLTGVAVSKYGEVYVSGNTFSTMGISTSGAHQDSLYYDSVAINEVDAFLIKFNQAGTRQWGTYFGGAEWESVTGLICDDNSDVYFCGRTISQQNIASSGSFIDSFPPTHPYIIISYLAKFNSSGTRLWSSYIGEMTSTHITSIDCDKNNNVYLGGVVSGNTITGLATNGTYMTAKPNANGLGLLLKLNSNGQFLWGTYYGGSLSEAFYAIECDLAGNVYATGTTFSTSGIASAGAYQTTIGSTEDAFLVKFNTNGQRQWATYFGGNGDDFGNGVSVAPTGNIFISGTTESTSGISTTNAYRQNIFGTSDLYVAEFTPAGTLLYSTYYGGNHQDQTLAFWTQGTFWNSYLNNNISDFTHDGTLYIVGNSSSIGGLSTTGAFQTVNMSSGTNTADAFLVAFDTDTTVYIEHPFTDTAWCPGDTVRLAYGVNMPFRSGNSFSVQLSDDTGSFVSPAVIGSITANTKDTVVCVVPVTAVQGTGYRIRVVADSPGRVSWDNQWDIHIKKAPEAFASGNVPVCTGDTLMLSGTTADTGVVWQWEGPGSFAAAVKDTFIANVTFNDSGNYVLTATLKDCSLADTVHALVNLTPDAPVATSNTPICEEDSLLLTQSSTTNGVSYSWSGPGSYSSTAQNPVVTIGATTAHAGDYIATATLNGCSSSDTATVLINPKPAMASAAALNSPLCARQDLQLQATTVSGVNYNWYGPTGYTAAQQNPVRSYVQFADSGYYYVYTELNSCLSDTDSVKVVVNTDPYVNIFPTPGANICKGREVVFTAIPTNGGSVSYDWRLNGVATGQSGTTYRSATLNDGDTVTCLMTSTGTCATAFTDTSNSVPMVVMPILAPMVSITASPATSLFPNQPVSFTAVDSNAGSSPSYQWRRNGQDIGGAISRIWGANANFMNDGDEICVLLTSSYACPQPDTVLSNCIKVNVRLSVLPLANEQKIDIYPNPANGKLHISGAGEDPRITVLDMTGRTIAATTAWHGDKTIVDISHLAAGTYMLRIHMAEEQPYTAKIIKE